MTTTGMGAGMGMGMGIGMGMGMGSVALELMFASSVNQFIFTVFGFLIARYFDQLMVMKEREETPVSPQTETHGNADSVSERPMAAMKTSGDTDGAAATESMSDTHISSVV